MCPQSNQDTCPHLSSIHTPLDAGIAAKVSRPGDCMNVGRIAQWVRAAPPGLPYSAISLSQGCASLALGYPRPVPPGRMTGRMNRGAA
jgi:hypothetical protein